MLNLKFVAEVVLELSHVLWDLFVLVVEDWLWLNVATLGETVQKVLALICQMHSEHFCRDIVFVKLLRMKDWCNLFEVNISFLFIQHVCEEAESKFQIALLQSYL